MRLYLIALAAAAILSACAGGGQSYQAYMQDYNARETARRNAAIPEQERKLATVKTSKLPKDYKKLVDARFAQILKDPDSRKVEFTSNPYGSLVCGTVNAKNSYGGYTGKYPFTAYFDESGKVAHLSSYTDKDIGTARSLGGAGELMHVEYELLRDCGAS